MTKYNPENPRILVYVDCSTSIEYEEIPLDIFSPAEVILLGIYPVSDQATPEQTRDNFGEQAEKTLERARDRFSLSDVEAQTVLKFTADSTQTMNTVAREENCDAILTPGTFENLDQILVPVKGTEHTPSMTSFISNLFRDTTRNVALLGFVTEEENESDHHSHLELFRHDLVEQGIDEQKIDLRTEVVDDVEEALTEEINRYDLAILGESEPGPKDVIVGSLHENVLNKTVVPLVTVRFPGEDGARQKMRN